ncbi:HAD family hydrolase [Arcanobacterium haemolyticum]|uniref:HAD-superfamily hydrolase, subfamily IA, variant 3 n=1 Tax=Arcanobacterium haemolyticum (strain ATCC 9345 / DSM 20595 / CCM 5947 / CCUG 17215 / LMG 16163 / NBRC 15585 / NCTC 8452 / 11018) TaxID=644284 RepID=D7BNY4_ARCHD|nr:HAD family phosphatase [Arcanobacterium haemolyticum]ADH92633.1 HAD-superfamily hydrolase, subfamily IA, variant 3 [Arcanobacterium haemolyticum DSM 20595]SPT74388.1 Phosphorylated carbohydrates phosphatase TM_1254 [Arcanobacterium haemolyticum]SQH28632.1 Phosphorylated carbohydrates phosphatase TM_1254 [Arcanobacterium haemolyticum]
MVLSAALFDMDGTLTDSEILWFEAERSVFARYGKPWNDGDQNDLIGRAIEDSCRLLVDRLELPLTPDELGPMLVAEVVHQAKTRGMPWRPGARELLEECAQRRIPTALVTSSYREFAQLTLDAAPEGTLTVAVTGDELPVGRGKPDPLPYLLAAEKLGVDITTCVAFEDSRPGIRSAHASGALTIAVPFQVEIPMLDGLVIVESLEELSVDVLEQMVAAAR